MKQRLTLFVIMILVSSVLVIPVLASPPQGPVTIETTVDVSSFPAHGDFEVVEGAGHDVHLSHPDRVRAAIDGLFA